MFKAYDVCIDEEGKRCIDLYDFYRIRENDKPYYSFNFLERTYPENIEAEVARLRREEYHNSRRYVTPSDNYNIFMTNPIALAIFAFKFTRLKIIEKVYAPVVIDDICYLIGYVVYIDTDTGEEFSIKTNNYGMWDDNTVTILKNHGYIHVGISTLINYPRSVTNRCRSLKLEED